MIFTTKALCYPLMSFNPHLNIAKALGDVNFYDAVPLTKVLENTGLDFTLQVLNNASAGDNSKLRVKLGSAFSARARAAIFPPGDPEAYNIAMPVASACGLFVNGDISIDNLKDITRVAREQVDRQQWQATPGEEIYKDAYRDAYRKPKDITDQLKIEMAIASSVESSDTHYKRANYWAILSSIAAAEECVIFASEYSLKSIRSLEYSKVEDPELRARRSALAMKIEREVQSDLLKGFLVP